MISENDEQLVGRAQAGDAEAFGCLIERHFGLVFTVALARLGNREAAEDLSQEVFLQLFLRIQSLRCGAQFPNWAARATRNLATDWGRRSQTRSRLVTLVSEAEEMAAPEKGARERIADSEKEQALLRALNDINPDQREVVLLHCVNGMTKRDIAVRLGVHPSSVGRQIDQALGRLRDMMTTLASNPPAKLLPPEKAVERSVALTVTAVALSSTARAALLSSPPMADGAKAVSAATVSLGTGTIKSIAVKTAGGIIMGKSTITVAGVVFAVIAGVLYFQHDRAQYSDPLTGVDFEIRKVATTSGQNTSHYFRAKGSFVTKRKSDDRITTSGFYRIDVAPGNVTVGGTMKDSTNNVELSLSVPPDITTEPMTIRLESKAPMRHPADGTPAEMAGVEFQIQQNPGVSLKQYNVKSNLLMKNKSDDSLVPTAGPNVLVEQGQNANFSIESKDKAENYVEAVSVSNDPNKFAMAIHLERK